MLSWFKRMRTDKASGEQTTNYDDPRVTRKRHELVQKFTTKTLNKNETYHTQVLLPIFHATENKAIPQRIKLVAPLIHDTV